MIKLILMFLISILLLTIDSVAQEGSDLIIPHIEQSIDSMPNGFSISIALIENEQSTFLGFLKEGDSLYQTNLRDSLFEIGSLTKVFTSSVLANEIQEAEGLLTDTVNYVFPYILNENLPLTYLSLANHTAGLYRLPSNILPLIFINQDDPYREYSIELFDTYLKEDLKLEIKDSVRYSYSNLGAGLLAYALSKKNNLPFEDLLKQKIFDKYGLTSSRYGTLTSFSGIKTDGTKVGNWDFNALKGAGGLISTTHDLATFIRAQFDTRNEELALTRKSTFRISDNMSIGLGWHIIYPETENEKFWHNGGTGGFTSSMSFRTSNKTGVVILSNISALSAMSSNIDQLCFELLDLLK